MQAASKQLIPALSTLFLLSGAAALIDQIAWQRMLFSHFGTDLETTTLVISVFMFGLGIGALTGGKIADRYPDHALHMFALSEAGVGLFAWSSDSLIDLLGESFRQASHATLALVNFLLLLPATLLMGATLPILVAFLVRNFRNIGWATGQLYACNTLGASLGALLAGMVLFLWLDLRQALIFSGTINLVVAGAVLAWIRKPK